jgi:predicted HTH domain antitoxin
MLSFYSENKENFMHTFNVQDLREKTDALIRNAEEGNLSLVTKNGYPVFVAVPFKDELLEWGVHVMLAICLYKEEMLSLSKAAKLSRQPLESFMEKLGSLGIPVVHYSEQDLEAELTYLV